jgi:hypothetical protein
MAAIEHLNVALGHLAVSLLSGSPPDFERGATLAMSRKLAGLFRFGLSTFAESVPLNKATERALERAVRTEAADAMVAREQCAQVLERMNLRGLRPVVLKGRSLALTVWPRPEFRPAGDLDLLIDEESMEGAVEALRACGYRPAPGDPRGRFRPQPHEITLVQSNAGVAAVDLHSRLFRSVGHRIDTPLLLVRARETTLDGCSARVLDDADHLLFLLIHSAKHAVSRLKWLLDLYALALRTDAETWKRALHRAHATRTERPFFAAARLLAELPGDAIDPEILQAVRPPLLIRKPLAALIELQRTIREVAPTRLERYWLEVLLEGSVPARARMAAGLLERWIRFGS